MAWGKPFQKGQSGNPKGRPRKGQSLTDALRSYLSEEEHDRPRKQILAERLWDLAGNPDPEVALVALRYIFERLDGKVPDPVDVNASGKMVIEVVRVPGRPKSQD